MRRGISIATVQDSIHCDADWETSADGDALGDATAEEVSRYAAEGVKASNGWPGKLCGTVARHITRGPKGHTFPGGWWR